MILLLPHEGTGDHSDISLIYGIAPNKSPGFAEALFHVGNMNLFPLVLFPLY